MADLSLLAEPFEATDIEWRAGVTNADKTSALALAYISSRAVMERLDRVVGPGGWRDEYKPGPNGGVICGISIRCGEEWVTKWDGAENTDFEAVKGGLSDAFKRAGVKWGIGRYLYALEGVWVKCEQRGKSIVLKETPKLPPWALPKKGQKPAESAAQSAAEPLKPADPKNWDEIVARVNELGLDLQKVKDELKAKKITSVNPETIPMIMEIVKGMNGK